MPVPGSEARRKPQSPNSPKTAVDGKTSGTVMSVVKLFKAETLFRLDPIRSSRWQEGWQVPEKSKETMQCMTLTAV